MHYNFDLSIIIPGIRNNHWDSLFDQISHSCKKYNWEVIFSSPYSLSERLQKEQKVKYVKNYGSPTRAMTMASLIAEGRFLTWVADDARLFDSGLDDAIDLLLSKNPDKDIVICRYTEGPGFSGSEYPEDYWFVRHHDDTKAPAADPNWKLTLVPLVSQKRFKELGGVDTKNYHHLNMNCIDFGLRHQFDGGEVHLSPKMIQNCDFEVNRTIENSPVIAAFWTNDRAMYWEHWKEKGSRPVKIDPENWRESDPVWKLRKFN